MAEKIKFTISPAVAAYVRAGTTAEVRLAGCSAASDLPPFERITLLFCLTKDAEPAVRSAAAVGMLSLPEDVISEYRSSTEAHPLVLEVLDRIKPAVQESPVSANSDVSGQSDQSELSEEMEDDEPIDEQNEEFQSKYKIALMMGIAEKIKMALSGDKEWRAILIKDSNKLVSSSVVKNPRYSDAEVLGLIKAGIQNDEIMRLICANKEWIKNYQIRKALVESSRTPVQNAMRYLSTMNEKDMAHLAKSKNIPSVISTMAKRLLLSKKR
ncbi:MAG TPA: hypothetical protein HPP94_08360 [Desulfuromonadales bacterium]|nr:hypothetical protein [Desulfuromonadales bacterium]